MRLFFISSGCGFPFQRYLSNEDTNMIQVFQSLSRQRPHFRFRVFQLIREPIENLWRGIHSFKPDVILVCRGSRLRSSTVWKLRRFRVPVGVWLVDDPYRLQTHERLVKPYHFVITQDSSAMGFYRKKGKICFHLPLAVNPTKYRPMRVPRKYRSDICFIGSGFPARLHTFNRLTPLLMRHRVVIGGQWWEKLKHYRRLKRKIINRPIPPSEVVKFYNGAKIVLNIHRTSNDRGDNHLHLPAYTPNNRTYEIAACRAFQLTTYRRDLDRHFRQGEIVHFQGVDDLRRKIEYYLAHPEERERIAASAYHRTLREHTYKKRLTQLLDMLHKQVLNQ